MNKASAKNLSPLQQAFLALEKTQAKLESIQHARTEPVAIIGLGCRMPGGADTPEQFWDLLARGVDTISEVPPNRWDLARFYDPDPKAPGKAYSRHGGFMRDVRGFDADFFGISPREAVSLDPQHRLLLETSWEALEDAGTSAESLYGSQTGIFVGISSFDYSYRLAERGIEQMDAYVGIGNCHSAAAGRLSYLFGFQGPSIAIDTSCSSSLVALHLACQSLRNDECKLALAGGVNALVSPVLTVNFAKAHMLSPNGRCRTFDAAADGYVRGEGAGMVVLKRLSRAVADGDSILAVIRGSAVNQDGPSGGLTVPNGPAQESVMRQALKAANVEPRQVSYVEAHGTGTQLGDPIEIGSLNAVFGANRERPLVIGSVKTNIGHLEAAAGIAAIAKSVLMLTHRQIPPHLHFEQPNPNVSWDALPLEIPTSLSPWQPASGSRILGVSSFGFSGTNAHIVLEEADPLPTQVEHTQPTEQVLVLSAKSMPALRQLCSRHATVLREHPEHTLADVAYTLDTGRSHFAERLAVVAKTTGEAATRLSAAAEGQAAPDVVEGKVPVAAAPRVAFLFPGEASHCAGVGTELLETQPTFRAAIEQCDEWLQTHLDESLISRLRQPGSTRSSHGRDSMAQPSLFAVEYALSQMWKSWGIVPNAVMGQGVGEYVAACVAGVFSLEDALRLLLAREPSSASPSPEEGRTAVAAAVNYSPANCLFVSTINPSGERDAASSAAYWIEQPRGTSRTVDGLKLLCDQGCRVFLELGPKPMLSIAGRRLTDEDSQLKDSTTWLATLNDRGHESQSVCAAQAALHVSGVNLDWDQVIGRERRRKLQLPTYPFQKRGYWVDEDETTAPGEPRLETGHPLLGRRCNQSDTQAVFETQLADGELSYLLDHRIGETAYLPASAYVELAIAAAKQLASDSNQPATVILRGLELQRAMPIDADRPPGLQLVASALEAGAWRFQVFSMSSELGADEDDARRQLAEGTFALVDQQTEQAADKAKNVVEANSQQIEPTDLYEKFQARGMNYGPSFRALKGVRTSDSEVHTEIELPDAAHLASGDYHLHPVLLDACLQGLGAMLQKSESETAYYLPVGIDTVRFVSAAPTKVVGRAHFDEQSNGALIQANVTVSTPEGRLVAELIGLRLRKMASRLAELGAGGASPSDSAVHAANGATPPSDVLSALNSAEAGEHKPLLVGFLQQLLINVLRKESAEIPNPDRNFFEMGLDSLMGIELVDDINRNLNIRLAAETLLIRPTIAELAEELVKYVATTSRAGQADEAATPAESAKSKPAAAVRLFCFHNLGGTASLFAGWNDAVGEDIDVHPVQLPGRDGRGEEEPATDFSQLVETLGEEMLELADRPFAFFAHSGGNLIAYEVAHLMQQRFGLSPEHLFVGSLWAPDSVESAVLSKRDLVQKLVQPPAEAADHADPSADPSVVDRRVRQDIELFSTYQYRAKEPLECPITAFIEEDEEFISHDDMHRWRHHTSGAFRLEVVAGSHTTYLANWQQIARVIVEDLKQVEVESGQVVS